MKVCEIHFKELRFTNLVTIALKCVPVYSHLDEVGSAQTDRRARDSMRRSKGVGPRGTPLFFLVVFDT